MTDVVLATELWDLRVAGQEVQDMGDAHNGASGVLGGVDPTSALSRPSEVGLGEDGFASTWTAARDAAAAMLDSNAGALRDCGQALIWCANSLYERVDAETAGYFDALNTADTDHD